MKKTTKIILITSLVIAALVTGMVYVNKFLTHARLLKHTEELAEQGKVITSEKFGINSSRKEIEAKWKKADKSSILGELEYKKHATIFGYGSEDKNQLSAFHVVTTDKSYHSITYAEVKSELGEKAEEEWPEGNEYFVKYIVHNRHDLIFCFSYDKKKIGTVKSVNVNDPYHGV